MVNRGEPEKLYLKEDLGTRFQQRRPKSDKAMASSMLFESRNQHVSRQIVYGC